MWTVTFDGQKHSLLVALLSETGSQTGAILTGFLRGDTGYSGENAKWLLPYKKWLLPYNKVILRRRWCVPLEFGIYKLRTVWLPQPNSKEITVKWNASVSFARHSQVLLSQIFTAKSSFKKCPLKEGIYENQLYLYMY